MRNRMLGVLIGLVACGACSSPASAEPTSEAEARALAASLLTQLTMPPGAVAQPAEPVGDNGRLSASGIGVPATPDLVDLSAWWTAGGTTSAALAYVAAHPPPGYTDLKGGGSATQAGTVLLEWITFSGPGDVRLGVSAAALAGGGVGLRADAEVMWTLARPASEVVPPGARTMVLTLSSGVARTHSRTRVIRSRSAIAEVTKLVNALPRTQPGVRSCPAARGGSARVAFYGSRGRPPLAVARAAFGGCSFVELTLAGAPQPSLEATPRLASELRRLATAPTRHGRA